MIAQTLITLAARALPTEERQRWQDEWLAELDAEPNKLRSLKFALSICTGLDNLAIELYRRHAVLRAADPQRSTPRERKMSVKLPDANMIIRGR